MSISFREAADCAVDPGTWGECRRGARANRVNANQMFAWRRAFERDELTQPCSALLPASASFVRDAGFTSSCREH
jgi:transposase-like protein